MGGVMTEPSSDEKERLAAKAQWIADSLAGKMNGGTTSFTEDELNAPASVGQVLEAHKNSVGRLHKLETKLAARVAALEAALSGCLKDGGTWKPAKAFVPGMVVTYRGVMWVCQEANSNTRPGTSDHWRLMEKSEGR
jgi:hypothetical protein